MRADGVKVLIVRSVPSTARVLFLISAALFVLKVGQIGGFAGASWWAVTAPLWGIPALVLGAVLGFILGICVVLCVLWPFHKFHQWRRGREEARREHIREYLRQWRMTRPMPKAPTDFTDRPRKDGPL